MSSDEEDKLIKSMISFCEKSQRLAIQVFDKSQSKKAKEIYLDLEEQKQKLKAKLEGSLDES